MMHVLTNFENTMSYFLKSGNTYKVSTKDAMDLHERLPVGTYTIGFDKMAGAFYLEQIENFELKGKIYGNATKNAGRILNTFLDRSNSTGVMLTGEKGSGKTMLTKQIAIDAYKQDIPTIVINQPWCGEGFNSFMQMIDQPTVVIFDEFEKVYDREEQESMLTLLDGVYPSKKLFLLTCNDKWRVDSHMRNRPGRIFYMIEFKGLDSDFIREYCEDNLDNKSYIDKVVSIGALFSEFNFDMLKAMVEEMNRYDESPTDVLKLLNAKPEFSDESKYKVQLQVGGVDLPEDKIDQKEWHGNPLVKGVHIDYKVVEKEGTDDEEWDWENCRFTTHDLKHVDALPGRFVFMNDDGERLVLTKIKEKVWHYDAF